MGGMVLAGGGLVPGNTAQGLAAAAMVASAVNIGGGFTITQVGRLIEPGICVGRFPVVRQMEST